MRTVIILLVALLVLVLILFIRVGGVLEYSEDGFFLRVRLDFFRITILPAEGKEHPKQQKKAVEQGGKEKPAPEEAPEEKNGGTFALIKDILPLISEAAGHLTGKIRIDQLVMHLTWATNDPALTALGFGAGNAALGMIWPLLDHNFNIKERDIGVAVDFDRTEPILYLFGSFSLTIGQGIWFSMVYGTKLLRVWVKNRKRNPNREKQPHS